MCPHPNVAMQKFGKHLPPATNAHTTIKKLLDALFSMRHVSYQILNMWRKENRRSVLPRTSCNIILLSTSRSPRGLSSGGFQTKIGTEFKLSILIPRKWDFLNIEVLCHPASCIMTMKLLGQ
jgi:hypothetical protein